MPFDFDAYVTGTAFTREGCAFALGDGSVRFEDGHTVQAHDGAILACELHPSGDGLITGGDDGRVVWTRKSGSTELAALKGRWIDAVAASPASGLIAYAAGKSVGVLDAGDPAFARTFDHEKSAAGLAFDPKGRRLAVATYGGAALWYARIADQKPVMLKWAGSHIAVAFSPDGRFLMSSMQESQLHGWRMADGKDLRMGGYPAKVKSMAFLAKGAAFATAGANGAVIWPFTGPNGPMGKEAVEIGVDQEALVTRVAVTPERTLCAAGFDNGRIWATNLASGAPVTLKAEKGAAISALAISPAGDRLAWGDEDGGAGVVALPTLG